MSNVYFMSDHHFGHRRIIEFCDGYRKSLMKCKNIDDHDRMLVERHNGTINKRDTVYILGDIGNIEPFKEMKGILKLILGNHDHNHISEYAEIFDDVIGPVKYKRHWLSHQPIHEAELWNIPNIHGHVHSQCLRDPRYVNVCVEMNSGYPVSFQKIKQGGYITYNRGYYNSDYDVPAKSIGD